MYVGTYFNQTVCSALDSGDYKEEQKFVQKIDNNMGVVESYIGQIPSMIFIVLGGALSDRKG